MTFTKNHLIILLVALLSIVVLFFTCNKTDPARTKYIPVVATIEKKVKLDSTQYHKSIDSLQAIEAKLYNKVYEQKSDLKTAQELVVELLNQPPQYSDTTKLLAQIEILKAANNTKDSLCNTTISTQDSIIENGEVKYQASLEFQSKQRQSINELITSNKNADNEIKGLKKEVKKEKVKKTGLKVALIGAIIYGVSKSL